MKRLLTAARRLLYPPQWVRLWIPPPVFAALIAVLAGGHSRSAAAYPIYGLSAYCLVIVLLPLPRLFCRGRAAAIRWISRTAYGKRYLESPALRAAVSIRRGVAVDFLYAAFRVTVGLRYASVWWIAMAAYYGVLGAIRLSLALSLRKTGTTAVSCYEKVIIKCRLTLEGYEGELPYTFTCWWHPCFGIGGTEVPLEAYR